jgi:hypothetical protein
MHENFMKLCGQLESDALQIGLIICTVVAVSRFVLSNIELDAEEITKAIKRWNNRNKS